MAFWLARKISKLCTDREALVRNRHNQSEQSQKHDVQTRAHASVVPLYSLLLPSRGEHYTTFLLSHTTVLAAVVNGELLSKQWNSFFTLEAAKQDLVTTLSKIPVLL